MTKTLLILAALGPAEKFAALRGAGAGRPALIDWGVWGPVLATLGAGLVLVVLYRHWLQRREAVKSFIRAADSLSLSHEERAVLARIAALAALRRIDLIFTEGKAFERGATFFLASREVSGMSEAGRAHAADVVAGLRHKLGFGFAPRHERSRFGRMNILVKGARVTVVRRGTPSMLAGEIIEAGEDEIRVQLQQGVEFRVGEAWRVRCVDRTVQWETDASVMDGLDRYVLLRLIGEPRSVNLRRYVRVPAHKPAHLAAFPFGAAAEAGALPVFTEGTLTEIAGPGLRVDSPLKTQIGDRVLVIVGIRAGRVIQGIGTVRRILHGDAGVHVTAVELISLSDAEIGELVNETNAAARQAGIDPGETMAAAEVGQGASS